MAETMSTGSRATTSMDAAPKEESIGTRPNKSNEEMWEDRRSKGGICIDVRWPWWEIQEVLSRCAGHSCEKPLIMSQSGHTAFGSTRFYAFPGMVFEVMQNGFLASLTL